MYNIINIFYARREHLTFRHYIIGIDITESCVVIDDDIFIIFFYYFTQLNYRIVNYFT